MSWKQGDLLSFKQDGLYVAVVVDPSSVGGVPEIADTINRLSEDQLLVYRLRCDFGSIATWGRIGSERLFSVAFSDLTPAEHVMYWELMNGLTKVQLDKELKELVDEANKGD